MQTFQSTLAGTASTTVVNIMAGTKFEFLSRPAQVRVYAASDITAGVLNVDFTLGNVVVAENIAPSTVADNTGPNRNEHLMASGQGAAGDRIQIRLQETAAVAKPVRFIVDIIDLA